MMRLLPLGLITIAVHLPTSAASADELDQLQVAPATPPPTFTLAGLSPAAPPAVARAAEPPPVFGISRDDAARLALLLGEVDDAQAERRKVGASWTMAGGASLIALGGLAASLPTIDRSMFIGEGIFFSVYGFVDYLRRPDSEQLRDTLVQGLASGRDPGQVVAEVDTRLHRMASRAHTWRIRVRWLAAIDIAAAGGLYLANRHSDRVFNPLLAGAAAISSVALFNSFIETPIERTAEIWDHEPALVGAPRFAVAPVTGGATLSLSGRF